MGNEKVDIEKLQFDGNLGEAFKEPVLDCVYEVASELKEKYGQDCKIMFVGNIDMNDHFDFHAWMSPDGVYVDVNISYGSFEKALREHMTVEKEGRNAQGSLYDADV